MRKLLRPVGDLASRIESWWSLGLLIVGAGLFGWLGQQWDALASQGWAAVTMVAVVSTALVAFAVSWTYLAIVHLRGTTGAPSPTPKPPPASSYDARPAGSVVANDSSGGELQDTANRQAINELVTFIRAQVDQVSGYTVAVLSSITVPMETKGELEKCAAYVARHGMLDIIEQTRNMLITGTEMNEPIQPNVDRLQHLIADYHRLHLPARNMMHELGRRLGHDFRSDRQYQRWKTLDENYQTKLRELASNPSYPHLRERIGNLGYGGDVYVH